MASDREGKKRTPDVSTQKNATESPTASAKQPALSKRQNPTHSETRTAAAKRILVVDDEEIVLTVASRMLQHLGYATLTADSAHAAIEIVESDPSQIDCVLLDLTMPAMDGAQCFRKLRSVHDDVCVVLSSGYDETQLSQRFGSEGFAGFIQKPYDLQTLRERLDAVLGKA